MPTYVYKFIDTGETLEVQQSFTDDTLTEAVHPTSGEKLRVKKVFQPVGVTFKGDGFYKTDSRGGKKSTTPTTTSGDGAGDSSSSESPSKPTTSDSSTNGSSTSKSAEPKKPKTDTKSSTSTSSSTSTGSSTKSSD